MCVEAGFCQIRSHIMGENLNIIGWNLRSLSNTSTHVVNANTQLIIAIHI